MKSPDTAQFDAMVLYGTFSTAQWQVIKADLKAIGIDLDTAMLPSMPDRPWWLPGDSTLRDAIQTIASYHGALIRLRLEYKPPTPLRRAEEHQTTLNALETMRDLIKRSDLTDHPDPPCPVCVNASSAGTPWTM